jgi:23S rRNA pseudouridine2605 synthase
VLNKPAEVVSTMSDPEGRRSLQELLHGVAVRVFPVGRLEYHSMGLVFLTNDGELANRMLKAHRLRQTYLMKLKSLLTFEEIEQLVRSTGVRISRVRGKESPWYEVTLTEARSDALRNRLFQTGHPVEKIKRIRLGNLELGSLQPGEHRTLSSEEVASLSCAIEGKLEPASEAAIKRTRVRRSPVDADPHHGGRKNRQRDRERQSSSGGQRRRGFKATKQSRTRPRKAR